MESSKESLTRALQLATIHSVPFGFWHGRLESLMRQKRLSLASHRGAWVGLLAQGDPERRVEDHAVSFVSAIGAVHLLHFRAVDFSARTRKCQTPGK